MTQSLLFPPPKPVPAEVEMWRCTNIFEAMKHALLLQSSGKWDDIHILPPKNRTDPYRIVQAVRR
ncbi:MAG: hypothetical protein M0Q91_10100 [Methanoregula sp.]|nr:hypothetical protein [Methanoregula sp.]